MQCSARELWVLALIWRLLWYVPPTRVLHGSSFDYLHPPRSIIVSTRADPFSGIFSKSNPHLPVLVNSSPTCGPWLTVLETCVLHKYPLLCFCSFPCVSSATTLSCDYQMLTCNGTVYKQESHWWHYFPIFYHTKLFPNIWLGLDLYYPWCGSPV